MLNYSLLRQLCVHFISLLREFDWNISSGRGENAEKPLKNGLNWPSLDQIVNMKMTSRKKSDDIVVRGNFL